MDTRRDQNEGSARAEEQRRLAAVFDNAKSRLWGLAYRMLGSAADADDALQDTYLRWQKADLRQIESPLAWLTTVCTRRCIDILRSAHRTRVDYVGPWLPEPLVGHVGPEAADQVELASSLATAFLLLLERLTPTERAAYLLREVFDYDYKDVAAILDKNQDACRKLVSRAKTHVRGGETRFVTHTDRQERLLREFLDALRTGEVAQLEALLAEDVEFWADGGGKAIAAADVIRGAVAVARFLDMVWRTAWHGYRIEEADVNGGRGFVLSVEDEAVAVLSLAVTSDGDISGVFVTRNPDKLRHIGVETSRYV
jgi:RNA polymerase sigma-70 factor (ECF subfamily)